MINYSKLTDALLRCERCYEFLNPSDLACIGSIVEYVAGNLCHQRIKVRNKSPSVNGRFLSRRFTYSKSKRSHWTDLFDYLVNHHADHEVPSDLYKLPVFIEQYYQT